jgi:hypothetical protein
MHLHVHLLQGNEDLAFLQHMVDLIGVLGVGSKGVHPSEVLLPGSFDLGTLGVMFHACPSCHTAMAPSLLTNSQRRRRPTPTNER